MWCVDLNFFAGQGDVEGIAEKKKKRKTYLWQHFCKTKYQYYQHITAVSNIN